MNSYRNFGFEFIRQCRQYTFFIERTASCPRIRKPTYYLPMITFQSNTNNSNEGEKNEKCVCVFKREKKITSLICVTYSWIGMWVTRLTLWFMLPWYQRITPKTESRRLINENLPLKRKSTILEEAKLLSLRTYLIIGIRATKTLSKILWSMLQSQCRDLNAATIFNIKKFN